MSFPFLSGLSSKALPQNLTLGQSLTCWVVSWYEPDLAEIELNGRKLLAKSSTYLEPGESIKVTVKQLSPQVQLSLIKNREELLTGSSQRLFRIYLPERTPMGEVLANLQSILIKLGPLLKNTPSFNSILQLQSLISSLIFYPEDIRRNRLEQIIRKLGLGREAEFRRQVAAKKGLTGTKLTEKSINLKGLILELLQELKTADLEEGHPGLNQSDFEILSHTFEDSAKQIELNQLLNSFTCREEGSFSIQIPFLVDGIVHTALIVFRYDAGEDGRSENGENFHSFSIYLEMQQLGDLKIEVNVQGSNLSCTIFTEDMAITEFIKMELPELENRLLNSGFNVIRINCLQASTKLSQESVIGTLLRNSNLLDLRV